MLSKSCSSKLGEVEPSTQPECEDCPIKMSCIRAWNDNHEEDGSCLMSITVFHERIKERKLFIEQEEKRKAYGNRFLQ